MWGENMSLIRAHIEDQVLRIIEAPTIASGGQNEVKITFTFCEKWDGFAKTATFYQDEENPYHVILDSEDTCIVPWEVCYEAGTFYVGVFGNKDGVRRTSTKAKYKVRSGAVTDGTIPSEPTPEVYDQIMSVVAEVKTEQEHFIAEVEGSVEDANQATANANRVAQELTEAKENGEFNGEDALYILGVGETLEDAPSWAQVVLDPDAESPELEMVATFEDGTTATYTIFGEVVTE